MLVVLIKKPFCRVTGGWPDSTDILFTCVSCFFRLRNPVSELRPESVHGDESSSNPAPQWSKTPISHRGVQTTSAHSGATRRIRARSATHRGALESPESSPLRAKRWVEKLRPPAEHATARAPILRATERKRPETRHRAPPSSVAPSDL